MNTNVTTEGRRRFSVLRQASASAALCLAVACAGGPELPKSQQQTQGDQAQVQILLDKANALYKAASKKTDVEPTMLAYEEVLKLAPDHREALVRAAEMHYYHGFDVVPESDKDKRMATYLKGRELGLRAMATNLKWREAYEKDSDMQKQLVLLGGEDAPAIYWAALNWAKWGELYGILRAAIDIPKVKAMMEFVQKNAAAYNGNAGDRFFIGYWVAIPGFAGKDPKKSKAAYDVASKAAPECLANLVTLAAYYAKDVEDRPLFESSLKRVIDAPADAEGAPFRLINGLAKEEAKEFLGKAKEWFE